jgi:large subunit ribosomal protein L32
MAVPKRKIGKARRDKRRASTTKMVAPNIIECPKCKAANVSHRECAECGFYYSRDAKQKEA